MNSKKTTYRKGTGLDVGTMNLVSARQTEQGKLTHSRLRDLFLPLPAKDFKRQLSLSDTTYVLNAEGDTLVVFGDNALDLANAFGRKPHRPLSDGLISAGESDAIPMLTMMLKSVLGPPIEEDEVCFFSVPARPLDQPDKDIIYHEGVFERIIGSLGYDPYPSNEAMAVVFTEAAASDFSALSFSFGSGMVNVALSVGGVEVMSFSVAKGGDWIDKHAGNAVGVSQHKMCAIKEAGIDLMNHKTNEEEALSLYYKALIKNTLGLVAKYMAEKSSQFQVTKEIPIIISGGTSQAGNFAALFKNVFKKVKRRFPLKISDIVMAKDPLNAVAFGLLLQARQEYENE